MPWTANGAPFESLDGGDTDWQREPIRRTLTLTGTGISERHILGFGPYRRTAQFLITILQAATYTTLRDAFQNGATITLVDDSGSYSAVRVEAFQATRLYHDPVYRWQGTMTFERSE